MASFEPTRTQWYGRRSSDPDPTTIPPGAWWYRTDLNCWKWFDGTSINYLPLTDVTITQNFMKSGAGAGLVTGTITATGLAAIVFVGHVEVVKVKPPQYDIYSPIHWSISANVIGVTIGMASSTAGTTVTVEAWFLGYR
jgi:hypothetical protein